MKIGYFIYKYVKNNEIIYIGKTKRPLNERINEHKNDLPGGCEIYYFECKSESDMNIAELFLIDKYRPRYNKDCNCNDVQTSFSFVEPSWKSINTYFAPISVFIRYEKTLDGLRAVYYNHRTGKNDYKKINYCDCDMDFPESVKTDTCQYSLCTECGRMIRNTFKNI